MKKVILALAIVSVSFTACNSGDKKAGDTKAPDSTATVKKDTATAPVVKDTTKPAATDTTKKTK